MLRRVVYFINESAMPNANCAAPSLRQDFMLRTHLKSESVTDCDRLAFDRLSSLPRQWGYNTQCVNITFTVSLQILTREKQCAVSSVLRYYTLRRCVNS